jgi:hypothetical protein
LATQEEEQHHPTESLGPTKLDLIQELMALVLKQLCGQDHNTLQALVKVQLPHPQTQSHGLTKMIYLKVKLIGGLIMFMELHGPDLSTLQSGH